MQMLLEVPNIKSRLRCHSMSKAPCAIKSQCRYSFMAYCLLSADVPKVRWSDHNISPMVHVLSAGKGSGRRWQSHSNISC